MERRESLRPTGIQLFTKEDKLNPDGTFEAAPHILGNLGIVQLVSNAPEMEYKEQTAFTVFDGYWEITKSNDARDNALSAIEIMIRGVKNVENLTVAMTVPSLEQTFKTTMKLFENKDNKVIDDKYMGLTSSWITSFGSIAPDRDQGLRTNELFVKPDEEFLRSLIFNFSFTLPNKNQ